MLCWLLSEWITQVSHIPLSCLNQLSCCDILFLFPSVYCLLLLYVIVKFDWFSSSARFNFFNLIKISDFFSFLFICFLRKYLYKKWFFYFILNKKEQGSSNVLWLPWMDDKFQFMAKQVYLVHANYYVPNVNHWPTDIG